jgi:hypothetical protein
VRGTFDTEGAPFANFRWMTAPSFYVMTVDQNGRPIEPEVLAVVLDALRRAVRDFTGGTLTVAALETGTVLGGSISSSGAIRTSGKPADSHGSARIQVRLR